jgi:hypothetical protein
MQTCLPSRKRRGKLSKGVMLQELQWNAVEQNDAN